MTIEEREKITWEFLETLDEQGLIGKVNSKLLHDEFTKNFPISTESAGRVFNTIIEQHEDGIIDLKASHEEMMMFTGLVGVNLINSYLEYIKKLLKILLDKNKIPYDDITTYGQLINNICIKLGWDKTKNELIRQNFFVDFRNAISHVDYYVNTDGIFFKIKKKIVCLNMDEFVAMINEIKTVIDNLNKFIVEKTQELENKAKAMGQETAEINKEADRIDKENEERRKKTLAIKNETRKIISETKRKERETLRIKKKTEMIERLKSSMNRNNARIVSKS